MKTTTNAHDLLTTLISCFGVSISIETINEVLSIALVVVSIINIVVMLFFRIRNIIKEKGINEDTINEVTEEIKDAVDDIGDVVNDKNDTDGDSTGKSDK